MQSHCFRSNWIYWIYFFCICGKIKFSINYDECIVQKIFEKYIFSQFGFDFISKISIKSPLKRLQMVFSIGNWTINSIKNINGTTEKMPKLPEVHFSTESLCHRHKFLTSSTNNSICAINGGAMKCKTQYISNCLSWISLEQIYFFNFFLSHLLLTIRQTTHTHSLQWATRIGVIQFISFIVSNSVFVFLFICLHF